MTEILRVENLTKRFQGIVANEGISLTLGAGEIRSIIGPNGAGKTTFISMISGHQRPTEGRILFSGHDITGLSVPKRARLGIARKFQTPSVFPELTVIENLELAVLAAERKTVQQQGRIGELLETIRLGEFAERKVAALSHGQRQWLEIGLLLGMNARLMLLDEPTAGMTAEETHATGKLIRALTSDLGLSAIIIEHDINFIRDLKAPVTVFHLGRVFREGGFESISADEEVRSIYLGMD
ncbi:ATP-binding cassette domain-containing protein [Microvirga massiliensis]|uniref:ATP-binding cassette domain-containing protein n=1 Tax=Microvirga massiliensis TaxID=1033741 RepID=UPI00062BD8B8|nr:ATP-binding cassette domain-containing protein [Microvirga massiliensis]